MKRLILPICLTVAGLIVAALCYFHSTSCISQQDADRIANDYAKSADLAAYDTADNESALLTSDLGALISGDQKWILQRYGDAFQYCVLEVDAHSGRMIRTREGAGEGPTPVTPMAINNFISFLPVIPYILMVAFSWFFFKHTAFRVLFWVSLGLFLLSLVACLVMGFIDTFFYEIMAT